MFKSITTRLDLPHLVLVPFVRLHLKQETLHLSFPIIVYFYKYNLLLFHAINIFNI